MFTDYAKRIQEIIKLPIKYIEAVCNLLEEGATIPFIARYRKELTGTMDEVNIAAIRDYIDKFIELDKRKEAILKSLEERELLTPELKEDIDNAPDMLTLEDIYLPYKVKRRTKAQIAREKGLEPFSLFIYDNQDSFIDIDNEAKKYFNSEFELESVEDVVSGAKDIIAEEINEDADLRGEIRELYHNTAKLCSKVASSSLEDPQVMKYKDYFDAEEDITRAPSHRVLAIMRGKNEGVLKVKLSVDDGVMLNKIYSYYGNDNTECGAIIRSAAGDAYKRLLAPSMENDVLNAVKEKADLDAVYIFANNLKKLLLTAPAGEKNILAIDPGYRTGCKVVCLSKNGDLLTNDLIYCTDENSYKYEEAAVKVKSLCKKYGTELIAIGDGTASRETETFVKSLKLDIPIVMVNESGASIYSASEIAREEFGDYDITVRGAVSIGRRLMDPLTELVKIDPKSIGVGQYQHDVDQKLLKRNLDDVVASCVNSVGVDINLASKQLLSYVSGIGKGLAESIIAYRKEHGSFKSRAELKKVKKLGEKAFLQCAGFLRINNPVHPLDKSAVHPESYYIVEQMAKDLNCTINDLMTSEVLRNKIDKNKYITDKVGLPTIEDILLELAKPGRDPRERFEVFEFGNVNSIGDLKPGMLLPAIVTNVTAFGAFVNLGVHQDGLVHKSHMSDRFVDDPSKIVSVNQKIKVKILDVDIIRRRISLALV